jgi:Pyruvate phosphate dikinase, AMP/ATP-binding domain
MRTTARSASVIGLADERASDHEIAGTKAAVLGRLWAEGLPVPDGVVLTVEVCRSLARGGRGERTRAAAAAVQDLGHVPVAVRSSAVVDDLPDASFAGQYETVVDGPTELTRRRTRWPAIPDQRPGRQLVGPNGGGTRDRVCDVEASRVGDRFGQTAWSRRRPLECESVDVGRGQMILQWVAARLACVGADLLPPTAGQRHDQQDGRTGTSHTGNPTATSCGPYPHRLPFASAGSSPKPWPPPGPRELDAVVCSFALGSFPDPPSALGECWRAAVGELFASVSSVEMSALWVPGAVLFLLGVLADRLGISAALLLFRVYTS